MSLLLLPLKEVHPQGRVSLLLIPSLEPGVAERRRYASGSSLLLELAARLRGTWMLLFGFDVHLLLLTQRALWHLRLRLGEVHVVRLAVGVLGGVGVLRGGTWTGGGVLLLLLHLHRCFVELVALLHGGCFLTAVREEVGVGLVGLGVERGGAGPGGELWEGLPGSGLQVLSRVGLTLGSAVGGFDLLMALVQGRVGEWARQVWMLLLLLLWGYEAGRQYILQIGVAFA